jgi:HD-GYP domain-containing protein (c-di-GMP phosphodiesterase class II)
MCDCLPTPIESEPDQEREEGPRSPRQIVTDLVTELSAAMLNSKIYFFDHPRVERSLNTILGYLGELGTEAVELSAAGEYVIYEQRPLLSASLSASRIIQSLVSWQSGGIRIGRSAGIADLRALLDLLMTPPQVGEDYQVANEQLRSVDAPHVELLPRYMAGKGGSETGPGGDGTEPDEVLTPEFSEVDLPVQLYQAIIDALQSVTLAVCHGGTINFGPVQDQAETILRRLEADDGAVLNLARHEQYDAFTFGHSVRVAVLAMNFARSLTSDPGALIRLGTAALLHDVGKSLIPFEILHSTSRLTPEERREINRHPELGAKILIDHRDADPLAIAAAFGHHKTMNEVGYPNTVHEHHLSAITHMVKICDTYEALTAARPYKRPMSPVRAYRIMMSMEGHFHPRFLKRFIEVTGVYPNGQRVALKDGREGRVICQTKFLLKPVIRVLTDAGGNPIGPGKEEIMDLSAPTDDGLEPGIREALKEDLVGEKE